MKSSRSGLRPASAPTLARTPRKTSSQALSRTAPASPARRKKAPEKVRAQLLDAASGIASEHGMQAVTLDAVAERAGVSKGGLQHHFRSKQALFDALFAQALERFETNMTTRIGHDPLEQGAKARAYLHATLSETAPSTSTNVLRVLVASMITDPATRERWAAPMRQWNKPERLPLGQSAAMMICRLAADGLWISELLGYQSMSKALKAEVLRQLEHMTAPDCD